ncbi:DUF1190 domain-containing protein [Microvirga sp. BT689]|uniref:DUF1190 domain-containing protein n=1 Tax=Microvirga arvi TaxID=2778731 RepID=UPI00194E4853|nr:DUF1190 domain-containing protein [Microvirga arvi]MBM6579373.1 DUF1190 domain-containing protein [Microvirga arvi]
MRRSPACVLQAVAALSGLMLLPPPLQAEPRTAFYVTSRSCQASGLLSVEECLNAFANAEAEYFDGAPVFNRQDECEKLFRRCVISFAEPPDPKALRYAPVMKGVQVSVTSARDRTAVPVLDGSHPAVSFSRRTVMERQDDRSPVKRQDVQVGWAAVQRPSEEPTWVLRGRVDPPDQEASVPAHPALALGLMDWCRRFCGALPARGHRTAGPDAGLFAPRPDPGAQAYEVVDPRQFSRPKTPASPPLPRFVRQE